MNKLHRSLVLTILASVFTLSAGGCWYAVAGAGVYAGYRFVDGEFEGVVRADLGDAIKAARAAFDDLDIREKSFGETENAATLEGVSAGNKDVQIRFEGAGDNATNIRIRVDTFGDESFSQLVLDKINDNL